jgi:hypothetical protein
LYLSKVFYLIKVLHLMRLWTFSILVATLLALTLWAESAPDPVKPLPPTPPAVPAVSEAGIPEKSAPIERAIESVKEVTPAALKLLPSRPPEKTQNDPPGECLEYDIRVNGIPAGKAKLLCTKIDQEGGDKGPQTWVIDLDVRSNRAVSFYYDVRISARSRIDVKGGFSRFFHIKRLEGDVRAEEQINFNYDIGTMHATYERARFNVQDADHPDGKMKKYPPIPLPGKVLDPLSALYYIRSMDIKTLLEKGLPICADRRVWNTRFKLSPQGSSVETVGKLIDRKCVAIEPQIECKGLFERKGKMTIWIDEATRIPLKMRVEIPIGTADVELSEFSHSPLNSLPYEEK